jgi:hypothetical protein
VSNDNWLAAIPPASSPVLYQYSTEGHHSSLTTLSPPDWLPIEDELGRQELCRRAEAKRKNPPVIRSSWKPALALEIEILNFIRIYGPGCALLTLIFPRPKSRQTATAEAQEHFRSIAKTLLPKHFRAYITILDFARSGVVHFHLLVACRFNILKGWDKEAEQNDRAIRRTARSENRPLNAQEIKTLRLLARQMVRGNPQTSRLFAELRRNLPKYGLPKRFPFELKPIRDPKAIARYLTTRYRQSHAQRDLRPPKTNCKRMSHSYERCIDPEFRFSFDPVGKAAAHYRRKKAAFGAAFGFCDIGEAIEAFGKSWEYEFRHILQPINPWDPRGFFSHQSVALREAAAAWHWRHL